MLGFDILDWAKEGALGNLDQVAEEQGWANIVPEALQQFSKHDGHWIAAPVNVHSTNWVWINKAALDKAGGAAPTSWEELVAHADTAGQSRLHRLERLQQPRKLAQCHGSDAGGGHSGRKSHTSTRAVSAVMTRNG
jgi:hypothetical protein